MHIRHPKTACVQAIMLKHLTHPKTACVQTIMLKHPTKQYSWVQTKSTYPFVLWRPGVWNLQLHLWAITANTSSAPVYPLFPPLPSPHHHLHPYPATQNKGKTFTSFNVSLIFVLNNMEQLCVTKAIMIFLQADHFGLYTHAVLA